jgi:hypothetical protein
MLQWGIALSVTWWLRTTVVDHETSTSHIHHTALCRMETTIHAVTLHYARWRPLFTPSPCQLFWLHSYHRHQSSRSISSYIHRPAPYAVHLERARIQKCLEACNTTWPITQVVIHGPWSKMEWNTSENPGRYAVRFRGQVKIALIASLCPRGRIMRVMEKGAWIRKMPFSRNRSHHAPNYLNTWLSTDTPILRHLPQA